MEFGGHSVVIRWSFGGHSVVMGTDKVAEIFYKQISRKRVNYKPRTKHFFKLYFDRHVQGIDK